MLGNWGWVYGCDWNNLIGVFVVKVVGIKDIVYCYCKWIQDNVEQCVGNVVDVVFQLLQILVLVDYCVVCIENGIECCCGDVVYIVVDLVVYIVVDVLQLVGE